MYTGSAMPRSEATLVAKTARRHQHRSRPSSRPTRRRKVTARDCSRAGGGLSFVNRAPLIGSTATESMRVYRKERGNFLEECDRSVSHLLIFTVPPRAHPTGMECDKSIEFSERIYVSAASSTNWGSGSGSRDATNSSGLD